MDDLRDLNRAMGANALGSLTDAQAEFIEYATICLAELIPDAAQLAGFLARPAAPTRNPLPIVHLNRQYLDYARLAAKDFVAGATDKMIVMAFTPEQAALLDRLTNHNITHLALHWPGLVYRFRGELLRTVHALHRASVPYYAAAAIAVRA